MLIEVGLIWEWTEALPSTSRWRAICMGWDSQALILPLGPPMYLI